MLNMVLGTRYNFKVVLFQEIYMYGQKKISSFVCDKPHSGQANFIPKSLEGCMEVECIEPWGEKFGFNVLRKGKIAI